LTGTRSTSNKRPFDPARDGFGFRNPVGVIPTRTGGGKLLRRFDAFVYGKGLCFGMAAASLLSFTDDRAARANRPPLAELTLTPDLLAALRKYHLRQFRLRTMLATAWDWVTSRGGRPERVLERIRLPGTSPDPHVLCFGPAFNWRFLSCFVRAHAVAPYWVEEGRVYIYDPNHPGDRERFVEFRRDEAGRCVGFAYGEFRSREGWGITLASACYGLGVHFKTSTRC
jgi:hypothetical protein